jgi:hypothetical protein
MLVFSVLSLFFSCTIFEKKWAGDIYSMEKPKTHTCVITNTKVFCVISNTESEEDFYSEAINISQSVGGLSNFQRLKLKNYFLDNSEKILSEGVYEIQLEDINYFNGASIILPESKRKLDHYLNFLMTQNELMRLQCN